DVIQANPAKGVTTSVTGHHLPKNIDVNEVNQLLNINLDDPLSIRDRAMLEVMYGAGLRLAELIGMDCRH
ncbi:MAG: tyrosine-type recombinase/integrase, partial [Candidatus Regiella insecticola]|nr:tyrosine-type recombinase/integrase [Candidatus Regiella insecticola]